MKDYLEVNDKKKIIGQFLKNYFNSLLFTELTKKKNSVLGIVAIFVKVSNFISLYHYWIGRMKVGQMLLSPDKQTKNKSFFPNT